MRIEQSTKCCFSTSEAEGEVVHVKLVYVPLLFITVVTLM